MKHLFVTAEQDGQPTLLLLHGTGGNEQDLLSLGKHLLPGAGLLSVRGQEEENGMPRFFRRSAPGVFDLDNLTQRTDELLTFLDEASKTYSFDRSRVVAVGYSNGANIAGSMFYQQSEALAGAVLFHPMVPRRDKRPNKLPDVPVWIGAGENDPMCPPEETKDLQQILLDAGAKTEVFWSTQGHQLSAGEAEAAKSWLADQSI
ncbi:alpha/beta hydrolase [Aureibacillus halotolerans]|uniref:Phospholipase/carboxylesterase n=1 Tax=Aureibacillus halotolerans TaxID=1508390 RepID=A0A4R6U2U6_9BACI|nr:alpha/beta hydrolase [Aureibacillus halotolerans]TDQ37434.1 phospholipase/carboxylesterase [Aureibacillus halotolerans]